MLQIYADQSKHGDEIFKQFDNMIQQEMKGKCASIDFFILVCPSHAAGSMFVQVPRRNTIIHQTKERLKIAFGERAANKVEGVPVTAPRLPLPVPNHRVLVGHDIRRRGRQERDRKISQYHVVVMLRVMLSPQC